MDISVFWGGFLVLIFFLLALDLGVLNRHSHVISAKEALRWTTLWVFVSILFSVFVYYAYELEWIESPLSGSQASLKYLTGYLVEQSLSMDNIFVIALIFAYFKVPSNLQHRVLFWGILGALFFRGVLIGFGVVLINRFSWMTYIFGAFLLYSAYKMLDSGESIHPARNPAIRFVKRFFPVSKHFSGDHFFVKRKHITAATPLFIALVMVETTDIMFAFDSIPAIFAITTDPFLVFTSNIFAILGLRSLYFVLASLLDKFGYLKYSLVAILFFVSVKMFLHHHVELPEWLSLVVIFTALASGVGFSLWKSTRPAIESSTTEKTPEDSSTLIQ